MAEKVSVENVNKKFRLKKSQQINDNGNLTNEILVLDNVDLKVKPGEFLVVVGPSGCGKSVLLDIIGGLTKPTTGKVFHDNLEVVGPNLKTGYVFQQYALFPWRTALSNIEFGLETRGVPEEERTKIGKDLLYFRVLRIVFLTNCREECSKGWRLPAPSQLIRTYF